ncbi:MAG: hypothetical protein QXM75_04490 [Candidatus Diapherotrites archaeon]
MGSKSFYEGWDSNRPNVILFINIGVGKEAKKFIIQAVGRGVRIEPIQNKRKRLKNLYNQMDDEGLFTKVGNETMIQALETLFVFSTRKNILMEIIKHLEISKELEKTIELDVNPMLQTCTLLIPVYKEAGKLYLQRLPQKMLVTGEFLDYIREYFNNIDDRCIIAIHEITPEMIKHIKRSFSEADKFYKVEESENVSFRVSVTKLIKHFSIKFQKNKVYEKRLKELTEMYSKEENFKDLKIRYIVNHYYNPVILSNKEKLEYIKHIIKTKSEFDFIMYLEDFIEKNGSNLNFDWWFFSKIDESLDKIYVPYYDPENNQIRNFYPDFIFWFKKGEEYHIAFVDPKGTSHIEFEYKVDGFKMIFEEENSPKIFRVDNQKVTVSLHLFCKDVNKLPEGYKRYWVDKPNQIFDLAMRI